MLQPVRFLYRSFRLTFCSVSSGCSQKARPQIRPSFAFNSLNCQRATSMVALLSRPDFLKHFSDVKETITTFLLSRCPQAPTDWLNSMLDYNVPTGKLNRGLTVVHTYQCLNSDISPQDFDAVCKLGWAIELLESCFLMADDIMDSSITRRGRLCWYKHEDVGLSAINDSFLLENVADLIMNQYLGDSRTYLEVLKVFKEAKIMTIIGQHMDSLPFDIAQCTREHYFDITLFKTSYYTFVLPILCAVRMCPELDKTSDKELLKLCFTLGHYFQSQDDYLDCFGDPQITGKIGTDIEDGKCTWLLVEALQVLDAEQKKIVQENYAKQDEKCVKIIKELYESVDMQTKYKEFERQESEKITSMIEALSLSSLKPLFIHLLTLLRGRNK